jgi:hypothetical protein
MNTLQRDRTNSRRSLNDEQGVIIVLVAVVMLGVVGAMAALSIDVVTLYTARSEAQLAADGAALAGARVLANSGMTSDTTGGLRTTAEAQAASVATQVATQNIVGGRNLVAGEVAVTTALGPNTDPRITVRVQRTDLPTFFARIWGKTTIAVAASATAEAYNSSGANALGQPTIPVAPICVKPWVLPNLSPTGVGTIFNAATGDITDTTLVGWSSSTPATQLSDGSAQTTAPLAPWKFYPGDTATTFAPPTRALPSCAPILTTAYQQSVGGCIQTPIACKSQVNIDTSGTITGTQTGHAVNCLAHTKNDKGDTVDTVFPPASPFEFIAGDDNPVALITPGFSGKEVMTSDSLVTVPVFNSAGSTVPPPTSVQIIGFVQLFVSPDGVHTDNNGPTRGYMNTQIINMVGCGTGATGTPILGNGASPVAVRLISSP